MKVDEITEQALALPSDARALLVDRLVESLDPAEGGELHQLWADEAQRRLRDLRSGVVEAVPGEIAEIKLREKYGQ
jgi:putative addiction module component (TIGR02574 family)